MRQVGAGPSLDGLVKRRRNDAVAQLLALARLPRERPHREIGFALGIRLVEVTVATPRLPIARRTSARGHAPSSCKSRSLTHGTDSSRGALPVTRL